MDKTNPTIALILEKFRALEAALEVDEEGDVNGSKFKEPAVKDAMREFGECLEDAEKVIH